MTIRKTQKSSKLLSKREEISNKLRQPKIFVPLIIIIIFGILYYFKGLFIVAIVNGNPISRISLIRELERRDGKQVLSSLVAQELILQEAKKKNVNVDKKEIDDETKKAEAGLAKQGQNLDQALAIQGLTRKDFIKQLEIEKLVEKIFAKEIQVSDKEVSDYVEQNKTTIPAEMKLEDVRSAVKKQLEQQKLSVKVQPWLQNLQKNAKINYFVNY